MLFNRFTNSESEQTVPWDRKLPSPELGQLHAETDAFRDRRQHLPGSQITPPDGWDKVCKLRRRAGLGGLQDRSLEPVPRRFA